MKFGLPNLIYPNLKKIGYYQELFGYQGVRWALTA